MKIFCDGSFNWKSKEKKGKIAFKIGKKKVQIKEVELEEVFGLKQYSNLFELKAVLESLKETKAKKICLFTDSQIIYWWITKKRNLSEFSEVHQEIQKEIIKRIERLKSFSINWIPREKNLAGIKLEEVE